MTTYPELLRRVLEDVRNETDAAPPAPSASNGTDTPNSKKVNGENGKNGTTSAAASKDKDKNGNSSSSSNSLAVPQSVIDEALRVTRESLEAVCEVDENGSI